MNNKIMKFAEYLNVNNNYDVDVLEYGITATLSSLLCLFVSLIVSIITRSMMFVLIYLLILTPLKTSMKSFHCKSLVSCCFLFNMIVLSNIILYSTLQYADTYVFCIVSIFLLLLVLIKYARKRPSKKISILYILVMIMLLIFEKYSILLIFSFAVCTELFLLILFEIELFLIERFKRKEKL